MDTFSYFDALIFLIEYEANKTNSPPNAIRFRDRKLLHGERRQRFHVTFVWTT